MPAFVELGGMGQVIAVAVFTVLAVISPGPDFVMVLRNSYRHGRGAGLSTAAGIALGVQVHVAYTLLGVSLFLVRAPQLLTAVKLLGAAYLVYLGIGTARAGIRVPEAEAREPAAPRPAVSFRTGFLCNALNPKTMLFVMSTFTQVVAPGSPLPLAVSFGLFMSAAHLAWFSLVAVFLTRPVFRSALLRRQQVLERVIGCVLIGLGVALAVSNLR